MARIRLDRDVNNNRMESNRNTRRFLENVILGLKKEDSALLSGLQFYHNHVRPHPAPGETLGEAADIHVEGDNPWLAIIESTARLEARLTASPQDGQDNAPGWQAGYACRAEWG